MANSSYQTRHVSMAHCPTTMSSGKYSRVPGDSILGIYGEAYERFQQGKFPCVSPPCSYCDKHNQTHLYHGPYHLWGHPVVHPTYGTIYKGLESYYRSHPYEYARVNGCQ